MPSITPPFYANLRPMTAVAELRGEFGVLNSVKELNITGGSTEFGEIAANTDVRVGFEYVSQSGENFCMAAGFLYEGDSGAFQILGNEFTMTFATPMSLTTGTFFFWPIPPDTYSESYDLIIRALAANDGVEKTGTLTIYDRFTFDGGADPSRVIGTVTLSKTYVAP